MNKSLIVAASALVFAVGAADKSSPKLAYDPSVFESYEGMGGPIEALAEDDAPVTYRPCRPGPGDDGCIQLYERGVRSAYAAWLRDGGGNGEVAKPMARTSVGGPIERRTGYPPCRRGRADDRCIQLYERGVARQENREANEPEGL